MNRGMRRERFRKAVGYYLGVAALLAVAAVAAWVVASASTREPPYRPPTLTEMCGPVPDQECADHWADAQATRHE